MIKRETEIKNKSNSSILVAVNDIYQKDNILPVAMEIAQTRFSHVHVLYVIDQNMSLSPNGSEEQFPTRASDNLSQQVVHMCIEKLNNNGISASGHIVRGVPAEEISAKSDEFRCDLVVVGHRHRSRLQKTLNPSIATQIVDLSPCPVLVIPCE